MKVLDLFSGIGGFSLGLERTGGFETVAFCDNSPKCRLLLNHHWPEVPAYDDVCTLTAERLAADGVGPIDAICGGFPCQDLSSAGRRAGIGGERSGLWGEFARLIRELRPRLIIVENVSDLLSGDDGAWFGRVLGDLAASGYDAEWDCIPASAVGAPHQRDRIWAVAYAGSLEHQGFGDAFRRALAQELSEAALGNAHRSSQDALAAPSGPRRATGKSSGWTTEPDVGRVAHGVPARVDRLHGLGNAVVPEIPYRLGHAVLAALQAQRAAA